MKTYGVTVPITGHAFIEVEAESEDDAIREALESISLEHIESWEAIRAVNTGNICHCMTPWEADAVEIDE